MPLERATTLYANEASDAPQIADTFLLFILFLIDDKLTFDDAPAAPEAR